MRDNARVGDRIFVTGGVYSGRSGTVKSLSHYWISVLPDQRVGGLTPSGYMVVGQNEWKRIG